MATPRSAASLTVRRMVAGSPAWKPQAMLAELTYLSTSASLPIWYAPKLSPTSQLRSTDSFRFRLRTSVLGSSAGIGAQPPDGSTDCALRRARFHVGGRNLPVLIARRAARRRWLRGRFWDTRRS